MPSAVPSVRAYVDLGDAFTKAIMRGAVRRKRVRFPSIVATRLLEGGEELAQLLLDHEGDVLRPVGFDPGDFPRTRSFPNARDFVREVRERPPRSGARFAGRLAATYGADRRLLGHDPNADAVEALVHKACMLACRGDRCNVEATFVVDTGAKAAAIGTYAGELPRTTCLQLQSYRREHPRKLELCIRGNIVDAAACAVAALPEPLQPARTGRLLIVDIGFLGSKLAVVSSEACEHQERLEGLGVSAVVRRVLRDGQDQGLVEDEFAVVEALEKSTDGKLTIAGRRFTVAEPYARARRFLEEELARGVERALTAHFARHAEPCRAVAILGGGARVAGSGLAERLQNALGVDNIWIAPEPDYLLAEGARRLSAARP